MSNKAICVSHIETFVLTLSTLIGFKHEHVITDFDIKLASRNIPISEGDMEIGVCLLKKLGNKVNEPHKLHDQIVKIILGKYLV